MPLSPASSRSSVTPLTWVAVVGGIGLENGWAEQGAPFGPVGYAIDTANGLVYLRGALNGGGASGTTAFTLPVAGRPTAQRTVSVFLNTYAACSTTGAVFSELAALCVLDGVLFPL